MTVKTSTGVKRVQDEKQLGAWFNQLFPLVQTRDSCNPDMAVESSLSLQLSDGELVKRGSDDRTPTNEQSSDGSLQLSDGELVKRASDNRAPTDEQSSDGFHQGDDSDKKQFVPIRKGRRRKVKSQKSSSALSTAVELFEKFVNNDCNDIDVIVLFTSGPHLRHNYHGNKTLETMLSGSVELVGHRK